MMRNTTTAKRTRGSIVSASLQTAGSLHSRSQMHRLSRIAQSLATVYTRHQATCCRLLSRMGLRLHTVRCCQTPGFTVRAGLRDSIPIRNDRHCLQVPGPGSSIAFYGKLPYGFYSQTDCTYPHGLSPGCLPDGTLRSVCKAFPRILRKPLLSPGKFLHRTNCTRFAMLKIRQLRLRY